MTAKLEADLRSVLPHTWASLRLDRLIRRIGDWVSWVWLALLATIVVNVVLRYAFSEGRIELEELQWHFYALGFLVALSYGLESDEHIRVDFIRTRLSLRTQAWIELYGHLLLLLPFIVLILHYCVAFIHFSFASGEVSSAPGGLPYRWIAKSLLFAGFFLLGLSVISRVSRLSSYLFAAPAAREPDPTDLDHSGEVG
jgi:TRAP-type mannitol/chloroaromatic compound transport system permease small subunit